MLGRGNAARLPSAGDLPALQPLLALPVVRDRDLHRPHPRPRRVLLLVDPPPPVLTPPRAAQRIWNDPSPYDLARTETQARRPRANRPGRRGLCVRET